MQPLRVEQPPEPLQVSQARTVEVIRARTLAFQAFLALRAAFVPVPLLAGIDKIQFVATQRHVLGDWHEYVAPVIPASLGLEVHEIEPFIGVLEVIAGLIVAVKPRIGGYLVALWLLAIIWRPVSSSWLLRHRSP